MSAQGRREDARGNCTTLNDTDRKTTLSCEDGFVMLQVLAQTFAFRARTAFLQMMSQQLKNVLLES